MIRLSKDILEFPTFTGNGDGGFRFLTGFGQGWFDMPICGNCYDNVGLTPAEYLGQSSKVT